MAEPVAALSSSTAAAAEGQKPSNTARTAAAQQQQAVVVFDSPASYHPLFWLFVAFVPVTTIVLNCWFVYQDDSLTPQEKETTTNTLIWTTVAVVVVFALVMPKRFEVVSDASVNVVTFVFKKWKFSNICAAYDQQGFFAEMARPKFKFAVNTRNRVIVRRTNGGWDLLVSANDPKGFVDAVWKVAIENDGLMGANEEKQ